MSRRKSSVCLLLSQLDDRIKDKILNMTVDKEKLKKFDEIEKKEILSELFDLRDLTDKSENEILKTLNFMTKNKQFFIYCGPVLININPGPNFVEDYLNLEKWVLQNTSLPETERKPHLYAYIDYIYETLVKENKDQVVNLLGQIGSGKTFNLVHIIEYLCYFHAPENKQIEFFDTIHKSMQLVHLLGSIFRQNNIESSSCGMLLKIGFDEKNKICNFDLNASILDFTLPFSENGRSFSILHALMTGAASKIKSVLDLPERETSLNFFRKFTKHFDKNTKDRFKLNDYEIWTRFHSLLSNFEFSKIETVEILHLFSFILICNEASICKKRSKSGENFVLNKGHTTKKLSKNFCLNEEEFIKIFGAHKTLNDMKNTLTCLMKHTYYFVFEYIINKIKIHLNNFFLPYKTFKGRRSINSFNNSIIYDNDKRIKNIYFTDIPGEVNDQTLGGMITNLANECQNLYAGLNYMSIVEKLSNEQLNIKYFQPLHSHAVIESLIGKDGILTYLSRPFTEKNFKRLKTKVRRKDYYERCCRFSENIQISNDNEPEYNFFFDFKFSQKNISFNYESLFLESKSIILTPKILNLFEASGNSIIKSQIKNLPAASTNNLLGLTLKSLKNIFSPIENLNYFVIYNLHSNNSLKIFFGEKDNSNTLINFNKYNYDSKDFEIPLKHTFELLRNGLVIPVLYWEWFGFHQWIDVELFVNEFSERFQKLQANILKYPNTLNSKRNIKKNSSNYLKEDMSPLKNLKKENIDLKKLNTFESANYILSVLCSSKSYIIGSHYILFKKDALNKARDLLSYVLRVQETENLNMLMGENNQKNIRKLSTNKLDGNSKKKEGNSRIGIPQGSNLIENISNNTIKNKNVKQIYNQNSNFNRYNERKMNNIISNTKSNISNGNSRSHSINNSFNRNPILNNEAGNNIYNNKFNNGNNEEVKENPVRRKTMKVQCHLEIINVNPDFIGNNGGILVGSDTKAILEAKNDLGLNLNIDPKKVNFNFDNIMEGNKGEIDNQKNNGKFNLFNYLNTKKANELNNDTMENSHTTYLESEYEMYKKQNNVIVPKSKYFNAFKNLFDYKNIENFTIFDYSDYINEVKLIQNNWRAYKSRRTYKVYRFYCWNVVILQKFLRGWILRKKFEKFRIAYRHIVTIQRLYKQRHNFRSYSATKIQSLVRMKMSRIYYLNKLARKDIGDDSDEELRKEEETNKNNVEPEYILQTEYEYEEVEETDEESDHEKNNMDNAQENDNEENFNQNNLSFSNDNTNNVSLNMYENSNLEDYSNLNSIKKNPIKSIGNMKDQSSNLGIKINSTSKIYKEPNFNIKMKNNLKAFQPINNNAEGSINKFQTPSKNFKEIKDKKYYVDENTDRKQNTIEKKDRLNIPSNKKENPLNKKQNKVDRNQNAINKKENTDNKTKNTKENKEITEKKKVKKKKKVLKLVKKKKLVPNPNVKTYEKANVKKALDRGLHYAEIISSGFKDKYLQKKKGKKVEKDLHDVSVSVVDRKKSMLDQSSLIGKKWYFNNMSLIQELEVDKDKRQILDILMKTEAIKGLDNSVNHLKDEYGIIKNLLNLNTPNKKPPKGKRIEDRLIEYGELVKMKKVGKKMEIMNDEKLKTPFKPTLQQTNFDLSLFEKPHIIEKSSLYHIIKDEKLDQLKQKYQVKDEDFDFKPRISSVSKKINRNIDDLFDWKYKLDNNKNNQAKMQILNEEKEILKNMNFNANKKSKILNGKNTSNFKKNPNRSQDDIRVDYDDNLEFDLWPDIRKNYGAY